MTKKEGADRLGESFRRIKADFIRTQMLKPTKTESLTVRLTEGEKQSLEQAAKACNLTITGYLIRLHTIALDKLSEKGSKA
jgi:hypothetical protein